MGTIVVGVDGSGQSQAALEWAGREASLRGSSVRAVHAYPPSSPAPGDPLGAAGAAAPGPYSADQLDRLRSAAQTEAGRVVDETVEAVADSLNGVDMTTEVVEGAAAETLVESARGADLLVVGSRGRGGFRGLLLGSVSQQCAQHAPCPVVIVRASSTARGGT